MSEMICKIGERHPARAAGYTVKFNYDGDYEVRLNGLRVKGRFWSEAAAWHWADEWVRLGNG